MMAALQCLQVKDGPSPGGGPSFNFSQDFECSGPVFIGGFEGHVRRPDHPIGFSRLRMPPCFDVQRCPSDIQPATPGDDHVTLW
jgi:hypothetical protein